MSRTGENRIGAGVQPRENMRALELTKSDSFIGIDGINAIDVFFTQFFFPDIFCASYFRSSRCL